MIAAGADSCKKERCDFLTALKREKFFIVRKELTGVRRNNMAEIFPACGIEKPDKGEKVWD